MSCKNSRDHSYIPFSRLPPHSIPHGRASKSRKLTFVQRHYFADKDPYIQRSGFPSSHVQMWELDNIEGRVLKNLCFRTVVLEKTLENPLDCKESKSVNRKGNQPWIFIGRTVAEALILWPPDEEPSHWKRPWCWERLKAKGEGGSRGWDG